MTLFAFSEFINTLLLEDRAGRIAYHKANSKLPPEHIDHLASLDPTEHGKYIDWIVRQHKAGNVQIYPPHSEIYNNGTRADYHRVLGHFDNPAIRNQLAQKDINQYKNINDIADAVSPLMNSISKRADKKKGLEGSEKIYDHPDLKVYKITSLKAAQVHGKGTKWCTSWVDQPEYAKSYLNKGPLYVFRHMDGHGKPVMTSSPLGPVLMKHQLFLHPNGKAKEFKDPPDHDDFWALEKIGEDHPKLSEIPELKNVEQFQDEETRRDRLAHSRYSDDRVKAIRDLDAHHYHDHLWHDKNSGVQSAILEKAHDTNYWGPGSEIEDTHNRLLDAKTTQPGTMTEIAETVDRRAKLIKNKRESKDLTDHIQNIHKKILAHPNTDFQPLTAIASSAHATPETLEAVARHDQADEDVLSTVLKHPNVGKGAVLAAVKSPKASIRDMAVKMHTPYEKEIHDAYLEHGHYDMPSYMINHQGQYGSGAGHEHTSEYIANLGHKEHLDQLVDHPHNYTRVAVMRHGHHDHLVRGMHDSDAIVRAEVARHKNFAPNLIGDKHPYVRQIARETVGK